jgi:hypothetical protein
MSTQVTLSLPDNVYHQATQLAQLMNQNVSLVLAETLENVLSPLGSSTTNLRPVEELSDPKVLDLVDLRMDKAQGKRLGKLLDRQQSGKLDDQERNELAGLMQVYHENLVRKAQALREAVRRGLR